MSAVTVGWEGLSESQRMRRVLWSSIIGTAVEWYDFLIYAVATTLVFNKLFFPSNDPALSSIIGFGTYGEQFAAMHVNQTFTGLYIGSPAEEPP